MDRRLADVQSPSAPGQQIDAAADQLMRRAAAEHQRHDGRHAGIFEVSQCAIGPAVGGFASGSQHMDEFGVRGREAQFGASHQARAGRSLYKGHFAGQVVGIGVMLIEHDDDLAIVAAVFQHRDQRILQRLNGAQGGDDNREACHRKILCPGEGHLGGPNALGTIEFGMLSVPIGVAVRSMSAAQLSKVYFYSVMRITRACKNALRFAICLRCVSGKVPHARSHEAARPGSGGSGSRCSKLAGCRSIAIGDRPIGNARVGHGAGRVAVAVEEIIGMPLGIDLAAIDRSVMELQSAAARRRPIGGRGMMHQATKQQHATRPQAAPSRRG